MNHRSLGLCALMALLMGLGLWATVRRGAPVSGVAAAPAPMVEEEAIGAEADELAALVDVSYPAADVAVGRTDAAAPNGARAIRTAAAGPVPESVPVRLRWIDEVSGEPAPLVSFVLQDQKGTVLEGMTDGNGEVKSAHTLVAGPVEVTLLHGVHESLSVFGSRRGLGSPRRRGGKLPESMALTRAEGGSFTTWRVPVQRLVPLRIDSSGEASIEEMSMVAVWAGSLETLVWIERSLAPVANLAGLAGVDLAGTTHVLEAPSAQVRASVALRGTPGVDRDTANQLSGWAHEHARELRPDRALTVMGVHGGQVFQGELVAPILPRLGQAPLQVLMRPSSAASLPHPALQALYGSEESMQREEIAEEAARKARPVYRLEGVLRSNTQTYRKPVDVRANPFQRNEKGGHDLRQQWITVEWQEITPGVFEAPFTLDELDGGVYEIAIVPADGTKVSEPRLAVDTTLRPPPTLRATILDR